MSPRRFPRLLPLLLLPVTIVAIARTPASGLVRVGPVRLGAAPGAAAFDDVPRDSVAGLVRRLERDPLDRGAGALRDRLLLWVTTAELGPCGVDATYITEIEKALERADYPYRRELTLQYMFGAARGALDRRPEQDCRAGVESGLRSLIAAYRTLARGDRFLRNRYLDSLDDLRRWGKLGSYIHDREIGK